MATTTHANFNEKTEGIEVAQAFAEGIRGKTILITGVNRDGLGFATAEAFASQSPAHLIITGRNESKLQESISALRSQFPGVDYRALKLDLSTQRTVRSAAAELLSWSDIPAINIVINNAGIAFLLERTLNEDGIEMTFATNHIGHYLFTCLIMPKLLKAAESSSKGETRVVNVTSLSPTKAHMRWSDINFEKRNRDLPVEEQPPYELHRLWGATGSLEDQSYLPLEAYNQTKVANVLFSIGLNIHLFPQYGISSTSVHPGVIRTELGRHMGKKTRDAVDMLKEKGYYEMKTMGQGVATGMVAALDPGLAKGVGERREGREGQENWGAYMVDCQVSGKARGSSVESGQAERLWGLSEELVGERFGW